MKNVLVYAALLVLLLGLFAFFQSSFFRLQALEIRGIDQLTADEVKVTLGIKGDQHLYSFTLGQLRERLLDDARIADAGVHRELPGKLVVTVSERSPVALVISGGVFAQIDKGGTVIAVDGEWPDVEVPVIASGQLSDLTLGESISDNSSVDKLLFCAIVLGDARSLISEIEMKEGHVAMHTTEGTTVMFPEEEEGMRRAAPVLGDILSESDIIGYTIDLRVPDKPVLRQPDD